MTKYRNQSRTQLLYVIKMLNDELTHTVDELTDTKTDNARYRDIIQALEEETSDANIIINAYKAQDTWK